jgi:hypothetical protein
MFVIADLKVIFHALCVGMFMICFQTRFKMSRSNDSLVTTVKRKAKENLCITATMYYTLQKGWCNESCIFSMIYYHTFQEPVLSGPSVDPTSQVFVTPMLL